MVEVAARRCEHGEAIESELTQVDAFPLARLIELVGVQDPRVSAAEDELAFRKRSAGEDASALVTRVTYLDVVDHAASLGTGAAKEPIHADAADDPPKR